MESKIGLERKKKRYLEGTIHIIIRHFPLMESSKMAYCGL